MSRNSLKLAVSALVVMAGSAAPVSLQVTPAALAGDAPLVRVNHACAATATPGGAFAACRPHVGYVCIVEEMVSIDVEPVWVSD